MYLSVGQTAERWGISERRVRFLCAQGRVPGAMREGRSWRIPRDAVKPLDGRRHDLPTLIELVHQKKGLAPFLGPEGRSHAKAVT